MATKTIPSAQLALSALCVCLSISIIGTAADALRTYRQQRDALNPWWLPLWPQHFNISGTPTLIGIAATLTVMHLGYLVATGVPRFASSQSRTLAWLLAMLVTVPGSLLALIAVVYSHVLNHSSDNSANRDTIMTWTCKFKDAKTKPTGVEIARNMTNEDFGKLCNESRFAYYAMIPVLLLQITIFVVAFVQWRKAGSTKHQEHKEYAGSTERDSPIEFSVHPK